MGSSDYDWEQLANGLYYTRRADGIHCFDMRDVTRETVDVFVEKSHALDVAHAAENVHARYLYLLRTPGVSRYSIARIKWLIENTPPDLFESTAIVTNSLFTQTIDTLFLRHATPRIRQSTRFFKDETDALQWLEERQQTYLEQLPER